MLSVKPCITKICKQGVVGSSPIRSTEENPRSAWGFFYFLVHRVVPERRPGARSAATTPCAAVLVLRRRLMEPGSSGRSVVE